MPAGNDEAPPDNVSFAYRVPIWIIAVVIIVSWFCVGMTNLPLASGKVPHKAIRWTVEFFIDFESRNVDQYPTETSYRLSKEYRDQVGLYFAFTSFLCPLILILDSAWATFLWKRHHKKKTDYRISKLRSDYEETMKKEKEFIIKPIEQKGVDDINTMLELLKDADRAIIYAGSFDWLVPEKSDENFTNATKLKTRIEKMAAIEKIVMIGYHKPGTVEKSLVGRKPGGKAFYDKIRSRLIEIEDKRHILLTVAPQTGGDVVVCTRVSRGVGTGENKEENLLIQSSHSDHCQALVKIVEGLADYDHWHGECNDMVREAGIANSDATKAGDNTG